MFQTPRIGAAALLAFASLCAVSACKKELTQAELHFAKGSDLFRIQDYAGCAAELTQSLDLDPKQAQATWDKCAFCFMKAGKLDKAGDVLLKIAQLSAKPEDKLANYRNAAGMYLQGQFGDKAEPAFLEAMKLDPKDEASLAWLAEISAQRGGARKMEAPAKVEDLEIALGRYDQLIAINPASAGHYVNKRIALAKLIGGLDKQRATADAATKANLSARIDELKTKLEETNKKLSEAMKAAKGIK